MDATVQEMVRTAMLAGAGDRRHLMCMLYNARERLPDENPLKRRLSFYWGADGPHSDDVQDALYEMVADGTLVAGAYKY